MQKRSEIKDVDGILLKRYIIRVHSKIKSSLQKKESKRINAEIWYCRSQR